MVPWLHLTNNLSSLCLIHRQKLAPNYSLQAQLAPGWNRFVLCSVLELCKWLCSHKRTVQLHRGKMYEVGREREALFVFSWSKNQDLSISPVAIDWLDFEVVWGLASQNTFPNACIMSHLGWNWFEGITLRLPAPSTLWIVADSSLTLVTVISGCRVVGDLMWTIVTTLCQFIREISSTKLKIIRYCPTWASFWLLQLNGKFL